MENGLFGRDDIKDGEEEWVPGNGGRKTIKGDWRKSTSGLGCCTPLAGSFNNPDREATCLCPLVYVLPL